MIRPEELGLEEELDSYDAECAAAAVAAACVEQYWLRWDEALHAKYTINIDNMEASRVVSGELQPRTQIARWAARLAGRSWMKTRLEALHVHGHRLHPWNEFVDRLAMQARTEQWLAPLADVLEVGKAPRQAMWESIEETELTQAMQYPAYEDGVVSGNFPALAVPMETLAQQVRGFEGGCQTEPHADAAGAAPAEEQQQFTKLELGLISAIASTMNDAADVRADPGLRQRGRRIAMMTWAKENEIALIKIQESRTMHDSHIDSQHYWVITSAADPRGWGGCELWIAKEIYKETGKSVKVPRRSIQVAASEDRLLAVNITPRWLKLTAAVVWASCSSWKDDARVAWWQQAAQRVEAAKGSEDLVVFMDANCELYDDGGLATGSAAGGRQSEVAETIAGFAEAHQICMPATFPGVNDDAEGRWTWRHPGNGALKVIDYVAIPSRWQANGPTTRVENNLDISTVAGRVDHRPIRADVSILVPTHKATIKTPARRFDTKKMMQPDIAKAIVEELEQAPPIPWQIEPSTHMAILGERLRAALETHAPSTQRRPAAPWMQEDNCEAVAKKVDMYKALCRTYHGQRMLLLRVHFRLWLLTRDQQDRTESQISEECQRNNRISAIIDQRLAAIMFLKAHQDANVKELVRRDKKKAIDEAAEQMEAELDSGNTQAAFQRVKRLRKFRPRPHNMVLLENRQPAATCEQARCRWQRHWKQRCGGTEVSVAELVAEQETRYAAGCIDADPTGDAVPSIDNITYEMRRVKKGRRAGEDAIPPEAFVAEPRRMAAIFHPLMVKCAISGTGPVQWLGATTAELPKKQASRTVDDYRAVHMADVVSKVYHRWTRNELMECMPAGDDKAVDGAIKRRGTCWTPLPSLGGFKAEESPIYMSTSRLPSTRQVGRPSSSTKEA
eukprot:TRINITY_DN17072_c0_g1_i4.p1 TRINITY_DN17072_c0_g1~~TRINITY_DN17072_c0_g1_i4.p1  ORF type:complete len:1012 (-),score=218.92 TRINITY_DN17072_c0_g1_i4:1848-4559(-)